MKNLKPIGINEFAGTFCKFNEVNFQALINTFKVDTFKLRKCDIKYLFITKDLKISCSYLNKKTLKKLNLKHIKLIDGLWYLKDDL
jgi:hypothetical protein